jgi:hypothetical protein
MTHEDFHNNFSNNKQHNYAKTPNLSRFAEPNTQFLKNTFIYKFRLHSILFLFVRFVCYKLYLIFFVISNKLSYILELIFILVFCTSFVLSNICIYPVILQYHLGWVNGSPL